MGQCTWCSADLQFTALSQTPTKAAKLWTLGQCAAYCAYLPPSFCRYQFILLGNKDTYSWPFALESDALPLHLQASHWVRSCCMCSSFAAQCRIVDTTALLEITLQNVELLHLRLIVGLFNGAFTLLVGHLQGHVACKISLQKCPKTSVETLGKCT